MNNSNNNNEQHPRMTTTNNNKQQTTTPKDKDTVIKPHYFVNKPIPKITNIHALYIIINETQ
jgi:hypothetical protein